MSWILSEEIGLEISCARVDLRGDSAIKGAY
jgi:hypothetical protein